MEYTTRAVDYDPFAGAEEQTEAPEVRPGLTPSPVPPVPSAGVQPAEPSSPPVARQGASYTTRPVDYDPFAPPKEEERGIAGQVLDTFSQNAFSRGVVSGAHDVRTMFESAVEGTRAAYDSSFVPDMAPPKPIEGYERRVPGVEDINPSLDDPFGTVDRAATWFGETLGSSLSQLAPTIGASVVTGVLTGGTGAVATPMVVSTAQNFGDVWQGFKQDKDIQKAIKEGRLTHQTAAQVAGATGILVGAVDFLSADKILSITGLKKGGAAATIKAAGKKALLAAAAKGAGFEGITEAVQSVIAQGAEVGLGAPEMVDWAERGLRTFNEFLAGAVGGGAAGAGVAVLTRPKQGEADEETIGAARQGSPEPGVAVPTGGGQATPGGTGTVAPPPAGAPAATTTPAPIATPQTAAAAAADPGLAPSGTSAVVPEGAIPPDVAAAAAVPPVAAAATPAPAPVAPAPVAPAPVAPVVERDEDTELEEDQDEDEVLAEIRSTHSRLEDIIRRANAAAMPTVPNQDIAAALTAGAQPAATPTEPVAPVAPVVPMPEPGPTAGAAVNRPVNVPQPRGAVGPNSVPAAQQQEPAGIVPPSPSVSVSPAPAPAPTPLAAEFTGTAIQGPSAPVAVPGQPGAEIAPVSPAAAPASEILTPPTYTTRPVDYDPFAGRSTEIVRPTPQQEIIPPKQAKQPYIVRQMADRLRQEVQATRAASPESDVFYEGHPDLEQAIGEVAAERTAELVGKRGVAPRRAVEQRVEAALKDLDQRLISRREAEASAEERATMVALAKSMETARRAKLEGKPQERARAGKLKGKKAEELRAQSQASWKRLADIELKKPEAERAQELVEYEKARAERARLKGRDKDKQTVLSLEIEKQQKAYIERVEREEAAAAQEPAAVPEYRGVMSREEARKAEAKQRSIEISKVVSKSLSNFPKDLPTFDQVFNRATSKTLAEHKRTTLPGYVKHINKAYKDAGLSIGDTVSFSRNSPEENLAIFANQLLTRREEYPGQSMSEFFQAVEFLRGYYTDPSHSERMKDLESLKGLISNEAIDARELNDNVINTLVAPEVTDGAYDPDSTSELFWEEGGTVPLIKGAAKSSRPVTIPTDEGTHDVLIINPKNNKTIRVKAYRSATASEVLAEVNKASNRIGKQEITEQRIYRSLGSYEESVALGQYDRATSNLSYVLRNVLNKQLIRLVGDTEIHFVPASELTKISGPHASYYGALIQISNDARKAGARPPILIDADEYNAHSTSWKTWLIMHEVAHAATSYALDNNIRGTSQIFGRIRVGVQKALIQKYGEIPESAARAMENADEFLSEFFGSPDFQRLLSTITVPANVRGQVMSYLHDPLSVETWWDMLVRMVGNAIAPFRRKGSVSYLEQVLALTPQVLMSNESQDANVRLPRAERGYRDIPSRMVGAEAAAHPFDVKPVLADTAAALDNARRTAVDTGGWFSRKVLKFATTEEMKRRSHQLFGEGPNVFTRLADAFLNSAPLRRRYQEEGHNVTAYLARYYDKDQAGFQELSDVMHDATLYQLDLSQPLQSPANAHISKKGNRDAHRRAAYNRLKPRWDALPQEAKDAGLKVVEHYRAMENLRVEKTVRNMLRDITRPEDKGGLGIKLPTGETVESVLQWVLDGSIDKPAAADLTNIQPGERNARDLSILAALGKTAVTLKNTRELRKIKGWYVPLMRWGRYFFTATENIQAPDGATVDATRTDGLHFMFKDEKKMQAYVNSGRDQVQTANPEYYKPGTDERVKSDWNDVDASGGLVYPEKRFRVVVQNRVMEMNDSRYDLRQLQKRYRDEGYKVDDIDLIDTVLHRNNQVLPQHINRVLRSVEQSSQGNVTAAQRTVQGAIVAAYIRQQAGTRASHRRLKRQAVRGFSRDFLHATNTANSSLAGNLAMLDIAPRMAELERELDEFIKSGRHAGKGETLPRKNYYDELKVRINAAQNRVEEHFGHRLASAVMEMSFVTHLMSPAYSIINSLQPLVTTWPVLAARFGSGAAGKEMGRALVDLAGGRIYWSGLAETMREARHSLSSLAVSPKNYDQLVRGIIGTKEPGFLKVMDRMLDLGYGASSGIESPEAIEVGRTRAEIVIGRMTRVARALPESIEAVNRYVTALATYRLAKRAGMSEDQAVELATTTVEQTQGGYAAENNPAYMSGKWLRLPLQFKKYAVMYAQLYWGAMWNSFRGADRETRVRAAKQLAALSATTVVFAGVGGLPMMEVAKGLILIANAFGLEDDDWEEWENTLQGYYADAVKWATANSSSSDFYAEMMQRGLTRAIGIDTSNRMGNDSMILFGEPRSMNEGDIATWILDLAVGAPGGMVTDSLGAISSTLRGEEADWGKILPFPKMMKDISKAYEQGTEGFTTKAGRQVAPPISAGEMVAQGLGFRPASVARQWETKGGGAKYASDKKLMERRTVVMGQWANATPAERQRIWRTTIREWNQANPGRRERIDMSDLRRSLATRKANARRENAENRR